MNTKTTLVLLAFTCSLVSVAAKAPINNDDHVDCLQVYDGIILNIELSDKNQIEYLGNSGASDFEINLEEGVLKIRVQQEKRKQIKPQMKIYLKEMPRIEAYAKAELHSIDTLKASSIDISMKSGSVFYAEFDCGELSVKLSEGSLLTASGKCDVLQAVANTSSAFSAFDLIAKEAEAVASTGGKLKLFVEESLYAHAKAKGYIAYKGNAKLQKHTSLGGEVEKVGD